MQLQLIKITAIGVLSFSVFSLIGMLVPGVWGRIGSLVCLGLCALPFFSEGSEDSPNQLGGIGVWVGAIAIASLALLLAGS